MENEINNNALKEVDLKMVGKLLLAFLFTSSLIAQTSIAVLELEGKGLTDMEASILTDRLRHELFQSGKYRVIERELMGEIIGEQGFQLSECTSTECMVEIGQLLGVDQMVGGSVSKFGSMFSIAVRLVSVETGEFLGTATYDHEGRMEDLLKFGMKAVSDKLSGFKVGETIATEIGTSEQTEEMNQVVESQPEKQTVTVVPQEIKQGTKPKEKNFKVMLRSELGIYNLSNKDLNDMYAGTVGPLFGVSAAYNLVNAGKLGDIGLYAGYQGMMFILSPTDRFSFLDDIEYYYSILRMGAQVSSGSHSAIGLTISSGYAGVTMQPVDVNGFYEYNVEKAGGLFLDLILSLRPMKVKNLTLDAGYGTLVAGEENIHGGSKFVFGGSISF